MNAKKFLEMVTSAINQNEYIDTEVVLHMGEGIIVGIKSIGTDGEGGVYIDCDGNEYLKLVGKL